MGVSKSLVEHMLSGELVTKLTEIFQVSVGGLTKSSTENDTPFQLEIRERLTNRKSKRTFEATLFVIRIAS